MHVLLMIALAVVTASLLLGAAWAVIGSRLGGGPAERERTLREGPTSAPGAPEPGREDPPAA
ncbi:hypothetical protein [Peterkaempfera sp. SMS 1(5)a]|uniref:hypothetical protein n=1 Tax=Peterkaempfera podocarpi TaxID=3232308 RepID=UPI00366E3178